MLIVTRKNLSSLYKNGISDILHYTKLVDKQYSLRCIRATAHHHVIIDVFKLNLMYGFFELDDHRPTR